MSKIQWSGDIELFAESIELHREIKQMIFDSEYGNGDPMSLVDLKETEKFLCGREKIMMENFLLTGIAKQGDQYFFIK